MQASCIKLHYPAKQSPIADGMLNLVKIRLMRDGGQLYPWLEKWKSGRGGIRSSMPLKSVFRSSPESRDPARQSEKLMGGAGKLQHRSPLSFHTFNLEQAALLGELSQFTNILQMHFQKTKIQIQIFLQMSLFLLQKKSQKTLDNKNPR